MGMVRQPSVVGGAYEEPVVPPTGDIIYPYRGGGFYPALCLAVFEILCLLA